jgi:hypothetical protein
MTRATTCQLGSATISISEALVRRSEARARRQTVPVFRCTECGALVDAHGEGPGSPAHFEHRVRNPDCSLSVPAKGRRAHATQPQPNWITTAELAQRTAGGDNYIRTKDGEVKGLALRLDLNEQAPDIVVVGKGPRIEARAKLFLNSGASVPTYVKRGTNAWELIGQYRATAYRTNATTIRTHASDRPQGKVAGILFLERTDEVTVGVRGGGFADPATRRAVELAAIAFVTAHYEAMGYRVHDYQRDNLGYDLLAVGAHGTLKLEVKGTDGSEPRFFLTRNEQRCASQDADWRLVVVTLARTAPSLQVLTRKEVEQAYNFDALAWECTPKA